MSQPHCWKGQSPMPAQWASSTPQPGRSPYLLWVEEDVSQALQAQHADLGAGVPEALGQHRQGCLFGEHFQQGRAVEELGQPQGRRVRPGTLSEGASPDLGARL